MTEAAHRKIWFAFGGFALAYAVAAMLNDRGTSNVLDIALFDTREVVDGVFAIPVICLALLVALRSGLAFAWARKNAPWNERIPRLGFVDYHTGSKEGRWVQRGMLILMIGIPIYAVLHFARRLVNDGVVARTTQCPGTPESAGVLSLTFWPDLSRRQCWNDGFRVGPDTELDQMVTFFPVVQPAIYTVLIAVTLITCLRYIARIAAS